MALEDVVDTVEEDNADIVTVDYVRESTEALARVMDASRKRSPEKIDSIKAAGEALAEELAGVENTDSAAIALFTTGKLLAAMAVEAYDLDGDASYETMAAFGMSVAYAAYILTH